MALIHRKVTARMIAANRANAQRSTGPRTARGKAESRLNALRTGKYSRLDAEYFRLWIKVLLTGPWEPRPPWKITEMPIPEDWPAGYKPWRAREFREFIHKVARYLDPETRPSRSLQELIRSL
jgi:hypothetical protein